MRFIDSRNEAAVRKSSGKSTTLMMDKWYWRTSTAVMWRGRKKNPRGRKRVSEREKQEEAKETRENVWLKAALLMRR